MKVATGAWVGAGRPPATTRYELELVAFGLFLDRGFEQTTVDEIAATAGISRRTFFHYFESKNDVVWGEFDDELAKLRAGLAAAPPDVPLLSALRKAVVAFNTFDASVEESHRFRMSLILHVPQLQAHSTLRYAAWRRVIEEFAAPRLAVSADSLLPRVVGHAVLGAAVAAYETWLEQSGDLLPLLDAAISGLADVLAGHGPGVTRPGR